MVNVSESFIRQIAQMKLIRGMIHEVHTLECPVCGRLAHYTGREPTPPINHIQDCAWMEARSLHTPSRILHSNLCMEIMLPSEPDMSYECVLGADIVMGVALDVKQLAGVYRSVKVVVVYGNGWRRCVSIWSVSTGRFDNKSRALAESHASGIASAWKTEYLGINYVV